MQTETISRKEQMLVSIMIISQINGAFYYVSRVV